jgi:hypothetical protein
MGTRNHFLPMRRYRRPVIAGSICMLFLKAKWRSFFLQRRARPGSMPPSQAQLYRGIQPPQFPGRSSRRTDCGSEQVNPHITYATPAFDARRGRHCKCDCGSMHLASDWHCQGSIERSASSPICMPRLTAWPVSARRNSKPAKHVP